METSGFDPREPGSLAEQIATNLAAILAPSSQNHVHGTPQFSDLMTFEIKSEFPLRLKFHV